MWWLKYSACGLLIGSSLLLALPAHAFSVRPNCDLRTLNLTDMQKAQLQSLRVHYKTDSERIGREIRQNRSRIVWSNLFESPTFDLAYARIVAQERYANEMAETVEELHFYHDMYQLLNPVQRRIWLNLCVRN